jgi:hypothetical protein
MKVADHGMKTSAEIDLILLVIKWLLDFDHFSNFEILSPSHIFFSSFLSNFFFVGLFRVSLNASIDYSFIHSSKLQPIPLYTTATNHPWYEARSPIAISIPKGSKSVDSKPHAYTYRYGVFRAGGFYRWEDPTDGPSDADSNQNNESNSKSGSSNSLSSIKNSNNHILPTKLLAYGEEYTVNDVLGVTQGHPNIDHIRVPHSNQYEEMTMLHSTSRQDSFNRVKSGNSLSGSGHNLRSSRGNLKSETKKKVGFAPEPPAYHGSDSHNSQNKKEPVLLNSTDGLIVASVFLPVHLHRSAEGEWSADWDYEALLSMQTHLRVTRIGVVKWRGWHGNVGKDGSPEQGVPVEERCLVEKCLRAFSCVPVWMESVTLGEM